MISIFTEELLVLFNKVKFLLKFNETNNYFEISVCDYIKTCNMRVINYLRPFNESELFKIFLMKNPYIH